MKNVKAYVASNIGNLRDNLEDNFFVPQKCFVNCDKQKQIKSNETHVEYEYSGNEGIFVVCDGMGGHNAGEVASRLAVEKVYEVYKSGLIDNKSGLIDFIKELNNFIVDKSEKDINYSNMGTTFSGIVIVGDCVYMLHVGDSRIYKYENDELLQISKDHTEGCRLMEAGIIKKEDLLKFPNRKSLYKYLGRKGELIADCSLIECLNDSRLLISSDGLSDTLCEDEISEILCSSKTPKEVCNNLIEKCLQQGNKCSDNVTIICMDLQ